VFSARRKPRSIRRAISSSGNWSVDFLSSIEDMMPQYTRFLQVHRNFPDEMTLIGRLITRYADLEIALLHCVQIGRQKDLDSVLKTMFRVRSISQRIDVADGLGRQIYRDLALGTQFEMAAGNMRFCSRIRSQYAHCLWHDDLSGNLGFVNLEELAESNDRVDNLLGVQIHYVDKALLEEQDAYFSYVEDSLIFVNYDGRIRQGETIPSVSAPKSLARPLLYKP
jgi:hypothetical protein